VGAFTRASNRIYEVGDRRFFSQRPIQLVITLLMALVLALVLAGLVLSGPLATGSWD
jgi:membrane protein